MDLEINSTRVDEVRHRARLDEAQLHALIAQAVAEQAGVDLQAGNVRIERIWLRCDSSSINRGAEYSAEVELVEDVSQLPRPEANPFPQPDPETRGS